MLVRNPVAPAAFDSLATQPNKGIVSLRRLRIAERMGRNLEVDDDRLKLVASEAGLPRSPGR